MLLLSFFGPSRRPALFFLLFRPSASTFNGTAPGACWEVYGMENATDYPRSMIFDINTRASEKQAFQDWRLTETPTCDYSPSQHAVATETAKHSTTQRAEFVVHQ